MGGRILNVKGEEKVKLKNEVKLLCRKHCLVMAADAPSTFILINLQQVKARYFEYPSDYVYIPSSSKVIYSFTTDELIVKL